MNFNHHSSHQSGVTLIELVVSIVIISIAMVGILSVMTLTTSHSADPMIRHQAIAIAQAYMEEIQLRSFCDPDTGSCGCTGVYEASRDLYDNVCDYNDPSLPANVRDQDNIIINELSGYTVNVSVAATALDNIPASDALKIDVQVSHATGLVDFILTSFRRPGINDEVCYSPSTIQRLYPDRTDCCYRDLRNYCHCHHKFHHPSN